MKAAIKSLLGSAGRGNFACSAKRLLLRNKCRQRFHASLQAPYYSQVGQDRFLDDFVFHGRRGGVFVDIGAYDGVAMSNSCYFERELGWRGLCVEPNPVRYSRLVENRRSQNVNCGVGAREGMMKFLQLPAHLDLGAGFLDYYDPQSAYVKEQPVGSAVIDVPVRRLTDLVSRAGLAKIDYLSIDTEGADFDIIRSIDFEVLDVSAISVENSGWEERIAAYMGAKGYRLVAVLGNDEIYLKSGWEESEAGPVTPGPFMRAASD